ncbi:hypothetical protein BDV06DRAFT_229131 [Aspergillus oleicola]
MASDSDPDRNLSAPRHRDSRERWTAKETHRLIELREKDPNTSWANFREEHNFTHRSATALMQRYSRVKEVENLNKVRQNTISGHRNVNANMNARSAVSRTTAIAATARNNRHANPPRWKPRRMTLGDMVRIHGNPMLIDTRRTQHLVDRAIEHGLNPDNLRFESVKRQIVEYEYDNESADAAHIDAGEGSSCNVCGEGQRRDGQARSAAAYTRLPKLTTSTKVCEHKAANPEPASKHCDGVAASTSASTSVKRSSEPVVVAKSKSKLSK